MEENDEISIETIITNRSKKNISSNEPNSNDYCDFEYNIDEILRSKNWVNENNINIFIDENDGNNCDKNNFDYISYFKNNKIEQIKKAISFKNSKKEILNQKLINNINSKSEKSIIVNNLENNKNISENKGDKKIIENEKNQINKNINKIKSISSDILTEIEIDSSKNIIKQEQNLKEIKPQEIQTEPNNNNITNNSKINNENNKQTIINITNNSNSNSNFTQLYNELEKEIEKIKNEKNSKNIKISERNKQLIEVLFKINGIFRLFPVQEEKYKNIFKQIINKINSYINNKSNKEIINLGTEIEEKQNINISLKKEYQKLMNSKPYKDKSKLNERKKIEYKEQLTLYDEIIGKISKMENILNNLTKKVKNYKEQKENNNIEEMEMEDNKLKNELEICDNTIKKLEEEINEKEKELSILNDNS